MRVDLTINEVGKTWQFMNEQVWSVKSNGKTFSFYSPHKPVVGSFIPCMVEERTVQRDGKLNTYRDARPIPKEILADDVPNFPTPSKQAEKPSSAEAPGGRPPELPQDTPEWAKPGPKPTLTGDLVLINRYLDALLNHPKINLANEVNWLGGFSSVIATGLRDYHDGKLVVETDVVPDDVRAAYLAAADGWGGTSG